MTWRKTAADRQRDAKVYGSPEYKRNREAARRRANGHCEQCGCRHARLQCDHITPKSDGGTNSPGNLQMLCTGPGTCRCHEKKTYQQRTATRRATPIDPVLKTRTNW